MKYVKIVLLTLLLSGCVNEPQVAFSPTPVRTVIVEESITPPAYGYVPYYPYHDYYYNPYYHYHHHLYR